MIKTDILLIIVPNVTQASVSSAEPGLDQSSAVSVIMPRLLEPGQDQIQEREEASAHQHMGLELQKSFREVARGDQ